tara:strand:- start:43 stop:216 length:174 start_codon:yes stop_codon:yes gene_type:complete
MNIQALITMLSKGNVDKTKDLVVELEGTKYEIETVRAGYGLIQLKPKEKKKVTKKDK